MAINFDNSDDFFGGESGRLAEPGAYHFLVTGASEQPTNSKGALIPNAILQLSLTVAEGPQKDKTLELTYFALKADASAKAKEWFNRKLIRIAYAAGLIGNKEIMGGKLPAIDFEKAKGRQLVMQLEHRTDANGQQTEYLDMVFANVWHVDDPNAPKDVAKNAQLIGYLPPDLRRTPEYFAELRKFEEQKKAGASNNGNGNGNGNGHAKPQPQPAAAPANISTDDLV